MFNKIIMLLALGTPFQLLGSNFPAGANAGCLNEYASITFDAFKLVDNEMKVGDLEQSDHFYFHKIDVSFKNFSKSKWKKTDWTFLPGVSFDSEGVRYQSGEKFDRFQDSDDYPLNSIGDYVKLDQRYVSPIYARLFDFKFETSDVWTPRGPTLNASTSMKIVWKFKKSRGSENEIVFNRDLKFDSPQKWGNGTWFDDDTKRGKARSVTSSQDLYKVVDGRFAGSELTYTIKTCSTAWRY